LQNIVICIFRINFCCRFVIDLLLIFLLYYFNNTIKIEKIIIIYNIITKMTSSIKFCPDCRNLLKINLIQDENKIAYVCDTCGTIDRNIGKNAIVVLSTNYQKSFNSYNHLINEFTTTDATLPRIFDMKCPNDNCKSKEKDEFPEIIYLRYDTDNLKYLYICKDCNYTWTNSN